MAHTLTPTDNIEQQPGEKFCNQADEELRAHAGETVIVTGEVKGSVLTVSRIESTPSTGKGL